MKWLDKLTDTETEIYGLGLTAAGFVFLFIGLFLSKGQQAYISGFATTLIITGAGAFGLGKVAGKKTKSKPASSESAPTAPTSAADPVPEVIAAHDLKRIAGYQKQLGRQPLCSVFAPIQPREATEVMLHKFKRVNKALQAIQRGLR